MKAIKILPRFMKIRLLNYLHKKHISLSQAGQDIWVSCVVFNGKRDGFFLDIGAHDGVFFSNTFILEKSYGWNGILIEANPVSFQELKKNRQALCINACLDLTSRCVDFHLSGTGSGILSHECRTKSSLSTDIINIQTRTLLDILEEYKAPHSIDYLSIDIEGSEERVLKEFPFTDYIFKCITIERPSNMLKDILSKNGYFLVKQITDLDSFYIHKTHLDEYTANKKNIYHRNLFWRNPWKEFIKYLAARHWQA